ncbi:MAG: hypothetical protein M1819_007029 [Sarea resinae]|nr:MAG: hypothetical protein M1819_007029 [Sarea resinae]
MPLHLLGKKSWNVYNADNIARVRQDEAAAKAKEEEEENRMQEVDAQRRMQLLRGEKPSSPPPAISTTPESLHHERAPRFDRAGERKRRKLAGEDDTDRDIRLAKEAVTNGPATDESTVALTTKKKTSDAPLSDSTGHINLFPQEAQARKEKNPEAEAEAARKKREFEDQYTMRFSNAAGFKQKLEKPWYSSVEDKNGDVLPEENGKDVWGNEDKGRKDRDMMRINSMDPLASIKRGVKVLKDVEREKSKWTEEWQNEMRALQREQERRHRKRRRDEAEDGLEGFSLDHPPSRDERGATRHDRHRHSHHSHRQRSLSRNHERHHHRSDRHRDRHRHRSEHRSEVR